MKRKPVPRFSIPFRCCSRCSNGMLVEGVMRGGKWTTEARSCECLKQWKRETGQAKTVGPEVMERGRAVGQ